MEQIDLSEIQELLDDILGGTVDFQQLVEQGTSGQSILSWGGTFMISWDNFSAGTGHAEGGCGYMSYCWR